MLPICWAIMFLLKLAGPLHTVFTVTGTSTDALNTTVQVRVTVAPIGLTANGLVWSLVTVTEVGAGTAKHDINNYCHCTITDGGLTLNDNSLILSNNSEGCASGLTSILTTIRQSERREGERRYCFSTEHCTIFTPLIAISSSSIDTTGETVAPSCSWSSSTITDCSRESRRNCSMHGEKFHYFTFNHHILCLTYVSTECLVNTIGNRYFTAK